MCGIVSIFDLTGQREPNRDLLVDKHLPGMRDDRFTVSG
tara:strand:+ start:12877 stop:12993 length:117 start_codon:yes stop_codon:yes gene_type:complete